MAPGAAGVRGQCQIGGQKFTPQTTSRALSPPNCRSCAALGSASRARKVREHGHPAAYEPAYGYTYGYLPAPSVSVATGPVVAGGGDVALKFQKRGTPKRDGAATTRRAS